MMIRTSSWELAKVLVKLSKFTPGAGQWLANKMIHSILTAYQQQIYEIDLERMAEGGGVVRRDSVWNESIQILNAAKKQLLGR